MIGVDPPNLRGNAASVLVFVLLLLMVGALVLGGIAQRAATQNLSAAVELELAERRVMLRNSSALARQFVLETMFFGYLPFPPDNGGSAFQAGFTNAALGGFSLTNASPAADFWQTVSEAGAAANVNPFSPLERGGFYRVILPAGLWNGTNTVGWNYLVRSRSPVAAGYSLVLQRPAVRPTSAVTFENSPYIDFLGPSPAWIGFPDMPVVPVSAVTNRALDPTGYQGFLDVPLAIAGADTLPEEGAVSWAPWPNAINITGWECVIDLGAEPEALPPTAYEYRVPGTRMAPDGGTNQIPVVAVRLVGTSKTDLPPLQLRMTDCPDVTELTLQGANRRSLYVNRRAVEGDAGLVVVMTDATEWRMGVTMQGAPITLLAPGLVVLEGGVRTDTEVAVDSAALVVRPDPDPGNLDVIGDRVMWLEDNRQ